MKQWIPPRHLVITAVASGLVMAAALLPREIAGQEPSATPPRAVLEVRVTGLQSPHGSIRLALFDTEQSFTRDPLHTAVLPAAGESESEPVVWRVRVEPGTYAVAAVHDRNGNERLDTNLLGMPKEPYGFSNGARGRLGPPSFDAASFDVGEGTQPVEIPLR